MSAVEEHNAGTTADAAAANDQPVAQPMEQDNSKESRMLSQTCRFYEKEFPDVEEVVMVNVQNIAEMGAYVKLLEYDNIEGMVLLSELSRRRIRSIQKLIRVGTNEAVMVVRVDKEKGYIDLSKRRVSQEDRIKCEDRYNKAKTVHSILRHVSEAAKTSLKDVYERVGWPLYRKFGHAFSAFQQAVTEPEKVLEGLDMSELERSTLLQHIKRKMAPQPVKVRADVEVTCLNYEGIDAVRAALFSGQEASTQDCPVKIQLVAPPTYVLLTQHVDKDTAINKLKDAMERIRQTITEKNGRMTVAAEPYVTSIEDEKMLANRLGQLQLNEEEKQEEED